MLQVADIKNKVLWKCRRGMLELDLLLEHLVQKHIFSVAQWQLLDALLDYQDPDLYNFLMGITVPVDKKLAKFITALNTC